VFDYRSTNQLINWSVDWLVDWPITWLVDRSVDWLVDWPITWLVGRLVDWLVDWSTGRLIRALVGDPYVIMWQRMAIARTENKYPVIHICPVGISDEAWAVIASESGPQYWWHFNFGVDSGTQLYAWWNFPFFSFQLSMLHFENRQEGKNFDFFSLKMHVFTAEWIFLRFRKKENQVIDPC
jgi:hypothetical protein